MKKKKRERKKDFRGKGGKGKKRKSSAGFKQVRLVLLVVQSVQREGVVGRIGFTFIPVSYTHLTLPTKTHQCRSRWSPYH